MYCLLELSGSSVGFSGVEPHQTFVNTNCWSCAVVRRDRTTMNCQNVLFARAVLQFGEVNSFKG